MLVVNRTKSLEICFLEEFNKSNVIVDSKNKIINEDIHANILKDARRAAEAHRRSRYKVQEILKPGASLTEIMNTIENSTRTMLKGELNDGIGFPTGMSLNDCAAHFTLNPDDKDIILGYDDVCKIDFGTHCNGIIMDSAFTVAFNPQFENLLKASKEATEAGIKALGVDVRVCDIGKIIAEVMKGYEITINGINYDINPMRNLNGHSIDKFQIHSGITIPNICNGDTTRIKADQFYALETFATTGKAYVNNSGETSHFIATYDGKRMKNQENNEVLEIIRKRFKTLPFCPRYLEKYISSPKKSSQYTNILKLNGHLEPYPPLYDSTGSYVAQFEHTIYLSERGKEVLTRGDDY